VDDNIQHFSLLSRSASPDYPERWSPRLDWHSAIWWLRNRASRAAQPSAGSGPFCHFRARKRV